MEPSKARSERLRAWLDVPLSQLPSVAADGDRLLFVSNATGLPQLWTTRVGTPNAGPRPFGAATERVGAVEAAPLGPHAVVAVDAGGNEHWQLARVDLDAPAGRGSWHALTSDPERIHVPGRWVDDGRRYRFSSNARDPRFFDVWEVDAHGPGDPRSLYGADAYHSVRGAIGDRTLVQRSNTNLDSDLLLLDGGSTHLLTPHDGELTILSAALRRDGVLAAANPGREFTALVRYRAAGAQQEFLREYPGDVELVEPAPVGDLVALSVNRDGWSEVHLVDLATREDRVLTSGPKGVVGAVSWLPDGSAFVYDVSSGEGIDLYRRTVATGKEKRLTGADVVRPGIPRPPKLARFRSSDGLSIPYWEHAPAQGTPRGTILSIHGGPESQSRPGFSPMLGYLVQEGWRVIAPNIRGSTGYGRTFVHLDDVRRRPDALRDVRELAEVLVREGKAERGRLGIVGGSYGGYVVLAAAARFPDLWGAAVDLVGIANFVTFLEKTAAWRRRLREDEYGRLDVDREFLVDLSPLTHAAEIRAPLLVVHGRNDPRVPVQEAEQIVASLRQRGRPVELLVFDDEGHGIVRKENQVTAWSRASEFLEEHLVGARANP